MGLTFSRRNNRVSGSGTERRRPEFPIVNIALFLIGCGLVTVGYTTGIGGNSLIISGFFLMGVAVVAITFKFVALKRPRPPNNRGMRNGHAQGVTVYSVSSSVARYPPPQPTLGHVEAAVDNPPPYSTVAISAPPSYDDVTKNDRRNYVAITDTDDKA